MSQIRLKELFRWNKYMTFTPFSAGWQIEIIFKTWKSLFQIHHWQTIKKERLECHVYGRLIAIFICSSTMFKMRKLLLQKEQKRIK
jgi:transposase